MLEIGTLIYIMSHFSLLLRNVRQELLFLEFGEINIFLRINSNKRVLGKSTVVGK